MSFKVYIKTYGCQMNERDSEMVAVLLQRHGFALAERESQADAVIVNTCSVRAKAEDKAIGKLRMLIAARQEHPDRIVGVVGCMVQRLKDDLFRKVPGLDFAVGTHVLARVPAILDAVLAQKLSDPGYAGGFADSPSRSAMAERRTIIDVAPADDPYDGHTHLPNEMSAFVNILFGCNRHCAYCVVPEVRGGEWSRPARDVIEEVRQLVAHGVKEVTLLGQSIMAYGRQTSVWQATDRSPRGFTEPLPRLLEALNDIPGLCRLRFTSGHPCGCTAELARVFAELPTVCEHLHLPLQSASDRILQLMNRGYTAGDYRAAVRRLQEAAPRIVLTTDVIVGFPTETPEEFDMTRAFLEEIGFDNVYIFKYNSRPGTTAAQWSDDVSAKEKLRRNHALLEDQGRRSQTFHQAFIGQACEVLVEGPSLRNEARWSGRTRQNVLAVFEAAPGLKAGDLVMIRIAQATAQALYGNVE
ncbi:MAG: tRNA (N6-isopentenyl adenosine(37)-C2)-methylthiotransferase MiaB [Verrucomicrobia bacterium]|nr:tRNA (N6-isopentenyl adenosine(37)-C2)-methylthiotransferase MiaB [Verrucomicrobiota bacterium]MBU1735631.1 tRNA (N6-isopentenyl adenosine(37)-C2)-methylthiotransferase MiaB [Verrucomicrobiota bacterium]MBU1855400.1 tRNA (N6-isopentenyl adenosine(37)-C2)-methylthiotransferase MiaB [Verrucomicrobiota bacterium]